MRRRDIVRPTIGITCDLDLGTGREARLPGRRSHIVYDDYVHAVLASGGLPVLLPTGASDGGRAGWRAHLRGCRVGGEPADIDPACYGEEPHARLGPVNPLR